MIIPKPHDGIGIPRINRIHDLICCIYIRAMTGSWRFLFKPKNGKSSKYSRGLVIGYLSACGSQSLHFECSLENYSKSIFIWVEMIVLVVEVVGWCLP